MKIAQPLDILYSLILSDGSLILARLIRSQIYTTFSTSLQSGCNNFLNFLMKGKESFICLIFPHQSRDSGGLLIFLL